jgi:hypothetical protein
LKILNKPGQKFSATSKAITIESDYIRVWANPSPLEFQMKLKTKNGGEKESFGSTFS